MATNCNKKHPLVHHGTSQDERFIAALEPGSARVFDFSLRDWMKFAWHYAARLNYFPANETGSPSGNWQQFMKAENEITEFLKDAELAGEESWISEEEKAKILKRPSKSDYEPHLALFLSFLKLMKFPQEQLNQFGKRHLNFYYTEVLKLSRKPFVPDRVHLIFEMARNAVPEILGKDASFEAGKDLKGKMRYYRSLEETALNQAVVSSVRSIFHTTGVAVKYASVSHSEDGLGAPLPEPTRGWPAFGNSNWPGVTTGFALASPVLVLKEGTRTITLTLKLKCLNPDLFPEDSVISAGLKVFLTSDKNWVNAGNPAVTFSAGEEEHSLRMVISLAPGIPPVSPYNKKVHGENFSTESPVIRFLVDAGVPEGYQVYSALAESDLLSATLNVEAEGMKDLTLENDQGRIDPAKPFYPFGVQPGINSNFYAGNAEVFGKKWKNLKLNFTWKNLPDFSNHYACYTKDLVNNNGNTYNITQKPTTSQLVINSQSDFKVTVQYLKNNLWYPAEGSEEKELFTNPVTLDRDQAEPLPPPKNASEELHGPAVSDLSKQIVRQYLHQPVTLRKAIASFDVLKFNPGFPKYEWFTGRLGPATRGNFIRLNLDTSFLHEHYARIYSMAVLAKATNSSIWLPREPYRPEATSVTLSYEAEETCDFTAAGRTPEEILGNYKERAVQLFHEEPFGQSEQHLFLKEQCDFLGPESKAAIKLAPAFEPEGEWMIGLSGARPDSVISLLIQVAEGSEDPMAPTFGMHEQVLWSILVNNEWKPLNKDYLLSDATANLLRPGILKLQLPPVIPEAHTRSGDNLTWLRATLPESVRHTSVCKIIGVHAQAAIAAFNDLENEHSHLETALPAGSISKMTDKPGSIKKVEQPYATFGGAPAETDQAFYQRISERLRHKQRSVTIWDYERMVLQQFPEVYKVKCLSHTRLHNRQGTEDYSELSPGDVTLIIVPDIRNRNSFDPLHPRASQNLLRDINNHIGSQNNFHVDCKAVNPGYETIHLSFRVKFHEGHDPNLYRNILNEDLIRHLSPWAYGQISSMRFGGTVYKNSLLLFIEQRPYVDFISQVKMYHRKGENDKNVDDCASISATDARTILVSDREHGITLIDKEQVCHE